MTAPIEPVQFVHGPNVVDIGDLRYIYLRRLSHLPVLSKAASGKSALTLLG